MSQVSKYAAIVKEIVWCDMWTPCCIALEIKIAFSVVNKVLLHENHDGITENIKFYLTFSERQDSLQFY